MYYILCILQFSHTIFVHLFVHSRRKKKQAASKATQERIAMYQCIVFLMLLYAPLNIITNTSTKSTPTRNFSLVSKSLSHMYTIHAYVLHIFLSVVEYNKKKNIENNNFFFYSFTFQFSSVFLLVRFYFQTRLFCRSLEALIINIYY